MTMRTVTILAVLAALSIGLAVYGLSNRASYQVTDFSGQRVFPALLEEAKTVSEVTVTQAGRVMTFDLKDGHWTLRESGGYRVHNNLVSKALFALSNMELLEPKTALPARHGELDLGDPMEKGGKSQAIKVVANGRTLADLVVGRANYFLPETTTGGMYVRRPGENQTWLVRGLIDLGVEPRNWLVREIVDFPVGRVRAAKVTQPDGEVLTVAPKEGVTGGFEFTNMPAGLKLKSEFAPRNIAALLNSFVLNDVKRADDVALDPAQAYVGEFETTDDIRIVLRMWKQGEDQLMTVEAAYAGADTSSDAAKLATEIAERTRGWVYVIPEYQYEQISKKMADVTEPADTGS